ncbi:MAG: UDP-N-acetylmuramoyl-tripeptide--D-alanyl-D-alanine ligase [Clostridia bacterium]|nr:UDP-N-acetylmuramoyl-tripeptide--D-alanyl-D-alanine ligase [Clostridia bacterium]
MNVLFLFLQAVLLAVAAVFTGWHLLHILQLESYQLPGYKRSLFRNPVSTIAKPLVVGVVGLVTVLAGLPWPVCLLLTCGAAGALFYTYRRVKSKKPFKVTDRVKRLLAIHAGISFLLELVLLSLVPAAGYLLPGLEPLVLVLCALAAQPVEKRIADDFIEDAQRRLERMPDMIKIGITGSYGKTSTKFLLREILSIKYRVLATPSSFNTPMGVTRVIREQLMPTHQIFIAEMGARHVGDIRELCDLVHPQIGLITSVGPQHLDTFGTIDRIRDTKYELIEALPEGGTALFAKDGAICDELFERCPLIDKYQSDTLFHAEHIQCGPWGTRFTLVHNESGEQVACETRLLGEYAISNLLLCCTAASVLGMTMEEIARGIRLCHPIEHRLQLLDAGSGISIIDDAFNSNPSGASAALHVLRDFPGRRIIVTPGMVELGDREAELNHAFGKEMAGCADVVFLVGPKHCEPIAAGLREAGFPEANLVISRNLEESTRKLNSMMRAGDVILYENDLPDNYNEA